MIFFLGVGALSFAFRDNATLVAQITEPIVWLLRLINFKQLTIEIFYEYINQLIVRVKEMEEVGALDAGMKHKIEEILQHHWRFVHIPLPAL